MRQSNSSSALYQSGALGGTHQPGAVDANSAALANIPVRTAEGRPVSWDAFNQMVNSADVVLLGESHDSARDHAFQLAFVDRMFAYYPGSALSMEQLERNEQKWVDAYLRGEMSSDELAAKTESSSWAGEGSWEKFYLPLIQEAKEGRAPVIAANTPRTYTRLAAREGLSALKALPDKEKRLFSLPRKVDDGSYRRAFFAMMAQHGSGHSAGTDTKYHGQQVWDATMADSIVKGLDKSRKIAHTVGRFHVQEPGGLIAQISARKTDANILVLIPDESQPWATARVFESGR